VAERVLITGAKGFIGSRLTERLLNEGLEVRTFVDYLSDVRDSQSRCDSSIACNAEVVAGDIRDYDSVLNAMKGCSRVFHLASLIGVPYSYQAASSYLRTNVTGTLNILQSARELNCQRVVYVSSSEVYGPAKILPVNEDHPLAPQSPYAATKCSADQLALSYHASFQTPVVVLRPFNTYGPGQSARAVIPSTIEQIAAGKKSVKLGALHPTRDFTYVADTVEAMMLASTVPAACGQAINIGSNFETSIGEVVQLIIETMGANVEIQCDQARLRPDAGAADRVLCDNTKARQILGWNPEHAGAAGLRKGLRQTVDSYLKPGTLSTERANSYHV
jgi:NAD dependent epimerase/dehydratase